MIFCCCDKGNRPTLVRLDSNVLSYILVQTFSRLENTRIKLQFILERFRAIENSGNV